MKIRKAQSTAEYAVLIGVVIAAFVSMQTYVSRALKARVKSGTDAMAMSETFELEGKQIEVTDMQQYEPYYLLQEGETYQEQAVQEHLGGGSIKRELVSDTTASAAGGYRGELSGQNMTTWDEYWENQ